MIDIDKIHKSFNHRDVLNGVSLRVEKGEIIAIIGGSGVGKSVLLKHITGLIRPDSGTISVDGSDVTDLRGKVCRNTGSGWGFYSREVHFLTR